MPNLKTIKAVKAITGRIAIANENSPIAVELVNGEPRSYFYSTVPAPKDRIEKKGEDGVVYGGRMLMPNRDDKNFLGVFHGAVGAANFKNMCFKLGLTHG